MKVHIYQQVSFEGPGSISEWAQLLGHSLTSTHWYQAGADLPEETELLVVLGGPMSVHDENQHPWLREEKKQIEIALSRHIPIVGICLGAQLIAQVLGAKISTNPYKEIGWFPIHRQSDIPVNNLSRVLPEKFLAFHWHGETFDLPSGAHALYRSDACAQQAYLYENHVLGLQCHLETTPMLAQTLMEECASELQEAGPYVQQGDDILGPVHQFIEANDLLNTLLFQLKQLSDNR